MIEEFFSNYGVAIVGCLLGFVFLLMALRQVARKRLIDDLPTSKTTGVFIGLVELKGTAESEVPLRSFLAETLCVYYQYSVSEHWSRTVTESYTDSKGNRRTRTKRESGWKTVASGGRMGPFYLQDDCGVILIRPDGADIEPKSVFHETCGPADPLYYGKGPSGAVADSDYRRQFSERAIPLHAPVYVVGQARERSDIVEPEIAYDKESPMFLISTRTEKDVSRLLGCAFYLWLVPGLMFCVGGFIAQLAIRQLQLGEYWWVYFLAAVGYFGALLLGWVWTVFNSLIRLRHWVDQAWSQIDVQLKRRYDLIPRLVTVVTAAKQHERDVQTVVADMRNQLKLSDNPDAQHGLASRLMAIAEAYPELKSNENFSSLQRHLIDTEQRIALARGYYNEIVTYFNTRLEIVPDGFIARLGGMTKRSLMLAREFERAPVHLNLAD